MSAAATRSLLLPRHLSAPSLPRRLLFPPSRHLILPLRRVSRDNHLVLCCVFPGGIDSGGGVADEFIYTRRSGGSLRREFSALAGVLLRIEPLDTAVVGKGVSAHAKDSMKRTISAMLGLLPSDQFDVSVRVSSRPLHQLLLSSIVTGYTLWNAEYRMSLVRNFESSPDNTEETSDSSDEYEMRKGKNRKKEIEGKDKVEILSDDLEMVACEDLGYMSPDALSYIQKLESELRTIQKDLDAQKCENIYLEHNKENGNNLLEYLRSLDPPMVYELSKPSSCEVEEIIQQLVQSTHLKFFGSNEQSTDTINQSEVHTSRDCLAKLLFWCMLLGHHLRGLEYRLHLSCIL